MKKRNVIILVLVIICLIIGYSVFLITYTETKTKTLIEEIETIKTDITNVMLYEENPKVIEDKLLTSFKTMNLDASTEIIDTLVYLTSQEVSSTSISEADSKIFNSAIENDNLDINKIKDINLIKKLDMMKENHIVVRYTNEVLFYDLDYLYFIKTYGNYMIPEYRAMMEFYYEEKENDYCLPSKEKLLTSVVENRINTLFQMTQTYKTSEIYELINTAYYFYVSEYLGMDKESPIYDSFNVIKPEVLVSYQIFSDDVYDITLGKLLKMLITLYETNEGQQTIEIQEHILAFCGLKLKSTSSEAGHYNRETSSEHEP